MQGIDISGHQKGINLTKVPCDFVIVKATQGKGYVNPDFRRAADQTLSIGKCLGLYHYINGVGVDAELDHFLGTISAYIGKAILALDWEAEQNSKWRNHAYCMALAEKLYQRTKIVPFLYMSKSVCREHDWTAVSHFFLWCAQYKNKNSTGYQTDPWTDSKGWGAWKAPVIMQYSSNGRLAGYSAALDLDYTSITPEMWSVACRPGEVVAVESPDTPQNTPESDKNPAPYAEPTKVVKYGTKGNDARYVQYYLNRHGYGLTVDGVIGKKSEAAIVHFQWKNGLTIDGKCGKLTRERLKAG